MTAPRYYGTQAWKRLRLRVLERDRFRCVICGGPAKVVDHVTSLANGGTNAPSNLRSLCPRCDRAVKEDASGKRRSGGIVSGCDAQGRPIDRNHWWNHR